MQTKSLPRAQFRYLMQHFFRRFFDTEAFALPHEEMHLLFVQTIALLVLPGLFKTVYSITKYSKLAWYPVAARDQAVLFDTYSFLCLSMILIGVVVVFEWDAIFPDERDFYNLTPLPIKPHLIFFAKLVSLALFVVVFHFAINGIATLLFPGFIFVKSFKPGSAGWRISNCDVFRYYSSHAISLFVSTLFVFASVIAIRSISLLFFPVKLVRIGSRCAQLALILLLLCVLFSFSSIAPDRLMQERAPLIYLFPPFWFLGIYETLIGHDGRVFCTLSKLGWTAVGVSCLVSIVSYTVSYWSCMQKQFLSIGIAFSSLSTIKKTWVWLAHKTFLARPAERACFHFIALTAFRRREHLLYIGSFVAVGIAFICMKIYTIRSDEMSTLSPNLNVLLSFPLIMSFFILMGLRFAFSIPADLNANWIFKITDKQKLEEACGGAKKFMWCAIHMPLLLVFVPCYLMIWSPYFVLLHVAYVSVLSLILIEVLLFRLEKVPFTCSYIPGKANIKLWWPVYVIAGIGFSYHSTFLERWLLQDMKRYSAFAITAGVILAIMQRCRSAFLKRLDAFRFEEEPEEQIFVLHIGA